MKMKNRFLIFALIAAGCMFLLSYGCKKKEKATLPVVTTAPITNITLTSATCGGNVTSDGGEDTVRRGVCWSEVNTTPNTNDRMTFDGRGTGEYTSNITGVAQGITYYVRAYAYNSAGFSYGEVVSFTPTGVPVVVTSSTFSNVNGTSAVGNGSVTNEGSSAVIDEGLCWSTSQLPTISDNHTTSFTATINGLSPNTTYYVRAYATNSTGTGYGNQVTLVTGYTIGTATAGGLVFYNDGNGHGLVCASTDQSLGTVWGCSGTYIGVPSFSTGAANTNTIVAECTTTGIAARLCYDLVLGSHSDWYLPAYSELNLMCTNLAMEGLGGFNTGNYWSSTEYGGTLAFACDFGTNSINSAAKTNLFYVRAIRPF